MNTPRTKSTPRQGSALLTIMIMLIVIMFSVGAVVSMTTHMPRMVRRQSDFIRAKAIAEAGINEAYSRLATNFSLHKNPDAFPLSPFANGSYQVTIQPLDDNTIILVSEGQFGSSRTHTSVELARTSVMTDEGGFGPDSPWAHAIFSNGPLHFNGTPVSITGDLHSNQVFGISGNPDNIESTVAAQTIHITGGDLPTGQVREWEEIPFPQLTDSEFVDLHQIAESHGTVLGSGTYRSGDLAGKSGNVLWFSGDVTFQGDFEFNGYVIVAGNVTFRGSGDRTINGLLYTQGNVTCNGSITLDGALLAGGTVTLNGASSVIGYTASPPPGVDPEMEDVVSISAWRE